MPPIVLIVDDEALIRMVASDVLTDAGVEVLEADDVAEAMDAITNRPDIQLIVTDINMPGGDGLELAREVHRLRPDVELIVSSGRERLLDRDLPDDGTFLSKPYNPTELLDLVRRKLDRAAERRAAEA